VQRFFRITLPLLRPTLVTTILLMTLLALANFTVVYIMTAGGPGTSTMILPVYSYQQAFQYDNLGYGALIGDAMVILATVLSFVYVRLSRERT
jgi:multiple sugar transport system permease protein